MSTRSMPPSVPQDAEAEQAVIGALLIDSQEGLSKVPWLRPADFYQLRHSLVFEIIVSLQVRGQTADFLTLTSELEKLGKLSDAGGSGYLASTVNAAPTAWNLVSYAKRVQHAAVCRRLIRATAKITQMAYEQPDDLDTLLADSEKALYEVRKERLSARIITPLERANLAIERYSRRQEGSTLGIPYGLLALDHWTQGAESGQLIVIAGRPGMGKTTLLQNLAENMARREKVVLFASCEMPDSQLVDRSVSGRIRLSLHILQRGEWGEDTWHKVTDALGAIAAEPFYVLDDADMTTTSLRSAAIQMRSQYGLDAIFVDYLQILSDPAGKGNEVERITGISRALKAVARAINVPVIAASQLSRAVEGRDRKQPQLSDLRASGSIEQDADLVAFIYRPGYYDRDKADPNLAEIIIAKQRNGPSGITSKVKWNGQLTRFEDFEEHREYEG